MGRGWAGAGPGQSRTRPHLLAFPAATRLLRPSLEKVTPEAWPPPSPDNRGHCYRSIVHAWLCLELYANCFGALLSPGHLPSSMFAQSGPLRPDSNRGPLGRTGQFTRNSLTLKSWICGICRAWPPHKPSRAPRLIEGCRQLHRPGVNRTQVSDLTGGGMGRVLSPAHADWANVDEGKWSGGNSAPKQFPYREVHGFMPGARMDLWGTHASQIPHIQPFKL